MADPTINNPFYDPNYGKNINTSANAKNPFLDPEYGNIKEKGLDGLAKDLGVSMASSFAGIPDLGIGMIDLMSHGAASKLVNDSGLYRTGDAAAYWNEKKPTSPKRKKKNSKKLMVSGKKRKLL